MSGNGIKGQSRAMLIGIDNFSEGYETKLYKSLESVANSAHKSVAAVEKLGYTLLNFGVAEKGGYEFTAARRARRRPKNRRE